MKNQDNELEELLLAENINVWSKNQSFLEEQALKELEAFVEEQKDHDKSEFTGERRAGGTEINDYKKNEELTASLNIQDYIKKQEELKKRQDFKKSLLEDKQFNRKHEQVTKKKRRDRDKDNEEEEQGLMEDDNTISCGDNKTNKNAYTKYEEEDNSGSEYVPSEEDYDSYNEYCDLSNSPVEIKECPRTLKKKRKRNEHSVQKVIDDGIWQNYKSRLHLYYKELEQQNILKELEQNADGCSEEDLDYHMIKGGLKVAINIWNKLYRYQQQSLKWLWGIHQKATGGLLGDEMGLGKTVQVIAFLHSLEYSHISSCHGRFNGLGPSIIVCPATVIHQWVKHFHEWAPEFRIAILHQSGSYQGNKAALIKDIHKSKGIIVTTYLGIIKYQTDMLSYNWHYLILDEGHKIRNPATKATVAIKLFRTPHRLMLTGSPMQNDLTELWSLFDFTNPGVLGNLKTFQEHFSILILHGGFSNSTPMQEATALSVATALKEIISPYLLRRTKQEVQHHILLPNKTEQVLFCSLSEEQKFLYKDYLMGDDVSHILGKGVKNWASNNSVRARVFVAITKLRKICNHPDIFLPEDDTKDDNDQDKETSNRKQVFGYYKKSGKMIVVSALLKIWKKQGHRVLLFTQARSMIGIFQDFLHEYGYKYLKMDGTTTISSRQPLIEKFNTDPSYDVFLLTTRVGGLGVNLTGANRVIIYDPDWNPATDTQARERAWRIGQDKEVTIYRLLTAGTIEEKMYQRQVWKQLLSNKILLDPTTNKFFKSSDLFDLFSLQDNSVDGNPESVNIFRNSRVRIQDKIKEKQKNKKSKESKVCFSEDKIQQMKSLAQQIAKSLNKKPTSLQLELEEEKLKKEEERRDMKELEPGELLKYNKEKVKSQQDTSCNEIDDCEAVVDFSDALKYSEETARLHHSLHDNKDVDKVVEKAKSMKQKVTKRPDKLIDKFKKKKKDNKVDSSGKVDGEKVEGILRVETRKKQKEKKVEVPQDDFILGKLFQKKGVFGAVQHESVIQEGSRGGTLKIHIEAKMRAEKSLEALKKSRIQNWRW